MKSEFKKQWTQITAVIAAAVCAVTATVAGVSGSFDAPINAYALEAGDEIIPVLVKTTDSTYYELDFSKATTDDAGKTVYVTLKTSESKYFRQGWTGMVGYWDNDIQDMVQDTWNESADSTGVCKFTFVITEGMIGRSDIQLQCWYPTVPELDSCTLLVEQDTPAETTTTTAETTTTTEVSTTTVTDETSETTTTEEIGETTTTTTTTSDEETTTTTTTTATTAPVGESKEVSYTTGIQTGEAGDIQAVAEFDPEGADYAVIVYKVNSEDTESSAGVGTWNGKEWLQEPYENLAVAADGTVTLTYTIPEDVGSTVKAMVFYPSNTDVEFQSITLHYGSAPATTTATTTTTGTELTFKRVSVNADNETNVTNKCCLYATMKTNPNTTLSGAVYYDNNTLPFSGTTDADGYLRAAFMLRSGLEKCNFKIQSSSGSSTVLLNLTSYYWGDASLNGKVNGSDVRAIINYIKSQTKSDCMDIVCDYNDDKSVSIADAVSLTKALLASAPLPGAN